MGKEKGMGLFKEAPYNKATQNIIDVIGCNYKVFSEECTVKEVNQVYEEELERGKKEGFVPVLVPCDDILDEWFSFSDDDKEEVKKETTMEKRQAIIDAAGDNGEELLQEWYNAAIEDYTDNEEDFMGEMRKSRESYAGYFDGDEEYLEDFMEEGMTIDSLSAFASFSGNGINETILFEVPVDEPWKVIGWFPMGGWNECPAPEDMITVCRYWYKKYSAFPAVITHDVIEFYVEKPIDNEDEAWKLAKEHFAFSSDRVYQCTSTYTLGEVADCLMGSTVWYFWWD